MMLCAIVLACVTAACTDPSGPGPAPSFIGLEPIANEVLARDPTRGLPDDSCPVIVIPAAPTVRYNISGSSATIALPVGRAVTPVVFARDRGAVFSIDQTGIIAISYDNDLPVSSLSRSTLTLFGAAAGERFQLTASYPRWCAVRIGGRVAVLHVNLLISRNPETLVQTAEYASDMALRIALTDGRRMNVRLFFAGIPGSQGIGSSPVLSLLSYAATLQW
jgi:hypothetical protein